MAPVPCSSRQIRTDVWALAWPSVLTGLLMTVNSILDRAFVGSLGPTSLAAVGVGGQVIFLLVSLSMAISVGTTALVARFTGAREPEDARRATGQSLALGLAMGLICTTCAYACADTILRAMAIAPDARFLCRQFLYAGLIGTVPMFVSNAGGAALRAIGDARTQLIAAIAANVVHMLGDWTLMLGHWGAPRLGVVGGGIAQSCSVCVSLIVVMLRMYRSPLANALRGPVLRLRLSWAWRILRIGCPAAANAFLRSTAMLVFTSVLARTLEGTKAVAALPIGATAESIAFMPGFGFSIAASTLVGQALGARDPHRASRYGWSAAFQSAIVMGLMGIVFFTAAKPFAHVFTKDATVLHLAVDYLRIMAFSEPALAFAMVLTGALQGAGDTLRPTVLTAISSWFVSLPLAWFLALVCRWNAHGAWISMCFATILGGLLTSLVFRSGAWKRIRV